MLHLSIKCIIGFFFVQYIKGIVDAGVNVIVTGGKVGDLAQHYCNKYKVLVVRLTSKWDLRRLCKAVGATALPKIVGCFLLGFFFIIFFFF